VSSTPSAADSIADPVAWLESFPQWPPGGLGLERMHALLDRLGHPERAYEAVHVVGTKGKSTAARTIAALLRAEGRPATAYTSPHVAGWWERLETDEPGFRAAVARVRADAEAVGASQFEILTAAALADFAGRGVEVAVLEAGVGGRLDATNAVDGRVTLLTNVGLEHTDLLGSTREEIAREKLGVARPGGVVVLPDGELAGLVAGSEVRLGGAREAAAAVLGRPVEAQVEVRLAGRLELRPGEVRDGAHTPEAVDWLLARLPEPGPYVVVASILADKDADGILERLARAGSILVATRSGNERSLGAAELAGRARRFVPRVETVEEPRAALARARELGSPLLVTGSLYLLADLSDDEWNAYDVPAR
jgi:dihydrofolate synthase/folylpolyglutamate synthase